VSGPLDSDQALESRQDLQAARPPRIDDSLHDLSRPVLIERPVHHAQSEKTFGFALRLSSGLHSPRPF
jgi:hypothetical protein